MSDKAQNRREFLANTSLVVTTVVIPAGLLGCSSEDEAPPVAVTPEFEEIADALEQNTRICCWTGAPGEAAKSPPVGAHLPIITFETVDGRLRATVTTLGAEGNSAVPAPHPMTPEHWIAVMYVRNQDGIVVYLRDFGQDQIKVGFINTEPRFFFDVPAGTQWLRAFSFCNLHQHWKGPQVDV